jgi:hypothetical protein
MVVVVCLFVCLFVCFLIVSVAANELSISLPVSWLTTLSVQSMHVQQLCKPILACLETVRVCSSGDDPPPLPTNAPPPAVHSSGVLPLKLGAYERCRDVNTLTMLRYVCVCVCVYVCVCVCVCL